MANLSLPHSTTVLIAGVAGLVAVLAFSRGSASSLRAQASGQAGSVPDTINTLTDAEREAGWRLLFDGSSLSGWRGYQRDGIPDGWNVEQGAIHFAGEASNSASIITTDTYDHFELRVEWKIAPDGNSGILYRVTEEADDAYRTGLEYQVLDNSVLDEGSSSKHQAGALYGLYAPAGEVTRPVGQYNEARIVVRGSHVEHWTNGVKLLEAEVGSEDWKARVAGTKFADWPLFAEAADGYIALQDHGHEVWYRDIKLRPLSPGR